MPRTIEVKLYQYDELTDKAKGKAREWFSNCEQQDFDPEYEPFETAAKLLGITIGSREVKLHSGKSRWESDIRWSGFYSQGDGASFVGTYEFVSGCSDAVRKEFPKDATLHQIADDLSALYAGRRLAGKSGIKAKITQDGRYVHAYSMGLEWAVSGDNEDEEVSAEEEKRLLEAMRDFANSIYKSLEAEWDWRLEDEQLEEGIRANEYEFTEDGERA